MTYIDSLYLIESYRKRCLCGLRTGKIKQKVFGGNQYSEKRKELVIFFPNVSSGPEKAGGMHSPL